VEELRMREIGKILLPIDFSEAAIKILQYAIFVAEKFNAKIFIIYVMEYPYTLSGLAPSRLDNEYEEQMLRFAEKRMTSFLEEHRGLIPLSYESSILSGHPAEKIINYAEMEGVDLIIIGTHGHKGLEKMLFGSVAEKVVKLAPCPVMTINTYKKDYELEAKRAR
jgi:nucleotide-binding universal stress UspA family protein